MFDDDNEKIIEALKEMDWEKLSKWYLGENCPFCDFEANNFEDLNGHIQICFFLKDKMGV